MRALKIAGLAVVLVTAAFAEPVPPLARSLGEIQALLAAAPGPIARITLIGDPARPGLYVQVLRIDPHTRLEPHHHSADRISTILSGRWAVGYGPRFVSAALEKIPAGSTFTEPAGVDHYGEAGDEPVYVEVSGMGPVTTAAAGTK